MPRSPGDQNHLFIAHAPHPAD